MQAVTQKSSGEQYKGDAGRWANSSCRPQGSSCTARPDHANDVGFEGALQPLTRDVSKVLHQFTLHTQTTHKPGTVPVDQQQKGGWAAWCCSIVAEHTQECFPSSQSTLELLHAVSLLTKLMLVATCIFYKEHAVDSTQERSFCGRPQGPQASRCAMAGAACHIADLCLPSLKPLSS